MFKINSHKMLCLWRNVKKTVKLYTQKLSEVNVFEGMPPVMTVLIQDGCRSYLPTLNHVLKMTLTNYHMNFTSLSVML